MGQVLTKETNYVGSLHKCSDNVPEASAFHTQNISLASCRCCFSRSSRASILSFNTLASWAPFSATLSIITDSCAMTLLLTENIQKYSLLKIIYLDVCYQNVPIT